MFRIDETDWPQEYALPLAVLFVPILLSVVVTGELLNLLLPASFVVGLILRPKLLWILWIGAVLMVWIAYGSAELLGTLPEDHGGETLWSFLFESMVFMVALVLLPMWIGRAAGRLIANRQHTDSA